MNRTLNALTLTVAFLLFFGASAQIKGTLLIEADIPPNLVAKHFMNYNNSSASKWYKDGSEFYVSFLNQDRSYIAKYNKSGRLLVESIETDKFTPQQIEKHLDFKFGKYRVLEVLAIRDIQNDLEFYQVKVKSKSRGLVTEWYDRALEPTDSIDGAGILAKN